MYQSDCGAPRRGDRQKKRTVPPGLCRLPLPRRGGRIGGLACAASACAQFETNRERLAQHCLELAGYAVYAPRIAVMTPGQFGLFDGMRPHQRVAVLMRLLGSLQRVELAKADIVALK
jgi:hypothetical protein